jgi:hypothetical protein
LLNKQALRELERVLADRSNPAAVTDHRAGTVSDWDRRDVMRTNLAMCSERDNPYWLRQSDRSILDQLAAGF